MNQHPNRRDLLLAGFIALSLLLHLLVVWLLPQGNILPPPPPEKPVYVELRPPAPPPKPRPRELDLPPEPKPEPPRQTPAKRLGPSDQIVVRETAPKGLDSEDRRPASPPARPTPPRQPPPGKTAAPKAVAPAAPAAQPRRPTQSGSPQQPQPQEQAAAEKPAPPAPRELPDLQALLKLPKATVARLEDQWRSKYREDVERGNAVWLDTEKDILISFFQRFRDRIYGVWNYPARSIERGEEGTCLLRITVNRSGVLTDVRLMESSGYRVLDEEALEAVRKASPFGPLPRSYEQESLNIFAFFKYNLTRRVIY